MSKAPYETKNFKLGYRPSLDGLRGVAVLAVLILHAYIPFTITKDIKILGIGGFLGVDIFFVLSGFLITALLIQEWDSNGNINFKKFYARRALRLLPALFVFMFACIVYSVLFQAKEESNGFLSDIIVITFYLSNWIPVNIYSLRHTWSLAVEEQFYLIYPIFLLTMMLIVNWLKLQRRWIIFFLFFLIAAIAAHRAVMFAQYGFTMRVYTGSDTRADSLLIGCLAALFVSWKILPEKVWFVRLTNIAAVGSLGVLMYLGLTAKIDSGYLYYGGFTIVALFVALIITSLQNSPPLILKTIFEWSVLRWIGRLSYGIYLWHKLVYIIIDSLPVNVSIPSYTMQHSVLPLVIKIGCSLVVAAVSFYLIEKPFLRLKKRFSVIPAAVNECSEPAPENHSLPLFSLNPPTNIH